MTESSCYWVELIVQTFKKKIILDELDRIYLLLIHNLEVSLRLP